MNEEQQHAIIAELDELAERARAVKRDLNYLIERNHLYKDETFKGTYSAASTLVSSLQNASDALKRGRSAWIQKCLTDWYRFLHWDTRPVVEIAEEDLTDPVYESITYKGNNEWEILMRTLTHGRERIVLYACDGVNWPGVYSAERL